MAAHGRPEQARSGGREWRDVRDRRMERCADRLGGALTLRLEPGL